MERHRARVVCVSPEAPTTRGTFASLPSFVIHEQTTSCCSLHTGSWATLPGLAMLLCCKGNSDWIRRNTAACTAA